MGQGGYFLHFGELFFSPLVRVERKVSLDRRSTRYILELVSFFFFSAVLLFFTSGKNENLPAKFRTESFLSKVRLSEGILVSWLWGK